MTPDVHTAFKLLKRQNRLPEHIDLDSGQRYFSMSSARLARLMNIYTGNACTRKKAVRLLRSLVAQSLIARIERGPKQTFWFRVVPDKNLISKETPARDEEIAAASSNATMSLSEQEAQCEAEAEQGMDDAESYDVYAAWDMDEPEDPEDNELFDKEID